MIKLASTDSCTGCGACAARCPKQCISMRENDIGVILPSLDPTNCVDCHACEKVCPILAPAMTHTPQKAYASWSLDEEERRTSASGGIAAEMYKYALKSGYKVIGAAQNEDLSVTHKIASSIDEISAFKNSKYVFSDAYDVLPRIKELLQAGENILFIGLPCQVAALRKLYRDHQNLLLVEVVCHGTTPLSYLRQHVKILEEREGQKTARMFFRDPEIGTQFFTFSLYNVDGDRFYAGRTKDGDTYQYGYHRAVTYRENCYQCHFARIDRIADITISDYKGLGTMSPCNYENKKVSSLLVNTQKGLSFVNKMIENESIYADARPLMEPISGDKQLRQPSLKTADRYNFEEQIKASNGRFEPAIAQIVREGVILLNKKPSKLTKGLRKIKNTITKWIK